jgi:hypothetical protein
MDKMQEENVSCPAYDWTVNKAVNSFQVAFWFGTVGTCKNANNPKHYYYYYYYYCLSCSVF